MKFIEVNCLFTKKIDRLEKQSMEATYGDDIDDWPNSEDYFEVETMSIAIDAISAFNPSRRKGVTTLRMKDDEVGFLVDMEYSDFKRIINNAVK